MKVYVHRIKAISQQGVVDKIEAFCSKLNPDDIIGVSVGADACSLGRNKFAMITYESEDRIM